jgi:hypothetical protein
MRIRYLGSVREITVGIGQILADLAAEREPASRPIERGTIEVRPSGGSAPITGGAFDVTAEDRPDLHAYRFLVTGTLSDPCRQPRDRVLRARRDLDTAHRDGVRDEILDRLRGELAARGRELDACLAAAGVPGVDFRQPLPLARSGDLFRTAPGDARDDGIRLLMRVLTPDDVDALNEQLETTTISTFISLADVTASITAGLPNDVTADRVQVRNGHLAIDFTSDRLGISVSGSMEVEVEPSVSHDNRQLLTMTMVSFDLDGPIGEAGELLFKRIRGAAVRAVQTAEQQHNSRLAAGLRQLFGRGGVRLAITRPTATLLSVQEAPDGFHSSVAVAFLLGSRLDPCQAIRDDMSRRITEIAVAERDGVRDEILDRLRGELEARRRDLRACRDATAPPPPPPPPPPVLRTVPLVREMSQTTAAQRVRDAGLVPRFTGPTSPGRPFVAAQSPAAGARVPDGSTVTMTLRVGAIP